MGRGFGGPKGPCGMLSGLYLDPGCPTFLGVYPTNLWDITPKKGGHPGSRFLGLILLGSCSGTYFNLPYCGEAIWIFIKIYIYI